MGVRLTPRPLSIAAAMQELQGPTLGGVVLFAGRVRPDRIPPGRVEALDYEAHRPLAVKELKALERRARARFGPGRFLLWHRIGRLRVGTISVIVGAAVGHRAEAFDAARYLIDELKATVPIWKTERARRGRPRRPRPSRRGGRSAG